MNSYKIFLKIIVFSISISLLFCDKNDKDKKETYSEANSSHREENTVYLATLGWLPYVGEELKDSGYGYAYQLQEEAFKAVGINVKIQFYPFARIFILLNEGAIDGYFPEYYSEDYLKDFAFTDPYPGGDVGFLVKKNRNFDFSTEENMSNFKSLNGLTVGVVRGYINTKAFDSSTDFIKEESGSDYGNIKKLLYNRIDAIFIDRNVGNYTIGANLEKEFPGSKNKFHFIEPALENKELYTCFSRKSKNYNKYIKKFNEGLQILKKEGKLDEILRRNNFENGIYGG